jgi:hypothetical protein
MPRKIDQDINAINPNTLGQLLVRQANRHQPVIGKPLQTHRNRVGPSLRLCDRASPRRDLARPSGRRQNRARAGDA